MNKCIRIDCYQKTANYKKPMSVEVGESYRLPPYSTVIGFVHKACGFKEYHDMKVSVQGDYHTIVSDMYTRYFMGVSYSEDRHHYKVLNAKGGYDGITRGLGFTELLTEVRLILHIMPQKEDFETVLNGLCNPIIYPALGRHEDILRIDSIEVVEIEPAENIGLLHDAYIPEYIAREDEGGSNCTRYAINKSYYVDEKRMCRIWDKVNVYHYPKGRNILLNEPLAFIETKTKTGVFLA